MAETVTTIAVAALAGGGVGAIASLLAPWAAWGVEKQRETRQHRRELLSSWRAGLTSALRRPDKEVDILAQGWFQSLRPYFNENEMRVLEGDAFVMIVGTRRDPFSVAVLDAIERQERAWGLD